MMFSERRLPAAPQYQIAYRCGETELCLAPAARIRSSYAALWYCSDFAVQCVIESIP